MTHNYATCGGPLECTYCRIHLRDTPEEYCQRKAAEDRDLRLAELRALDGHDYEPPDPYKDALAKLRQDTMTDQQKWEDEYLRQWRIDQAIERNTPDLPIPPWPTPPPEDHSFDPPDPYAEGLEKLRSTR